MGRVPWIHEPGVSQWVQHLSDRGRITLSGGGDAVLRLLLRVRQPLPAPAPLDPAYRQLHWHSAHIHLHHR